MTFHSDFTLAESVDRLLCAVVPGGFDAESTDSIMGSVTADLVELWHNRPLPHSSITRFHMLGSFVQHPGGVVLFCQFVERLMFRLSPSPAYALLHPSFRAEVMLLSSVVEQALTRPA